MGEGRRQIPARPTALSVGWHPGACAAGPAASGGRTIRLAVRARRSGSGALSCQGIAAAARDRVGRRTRRMTQVAIRDRRHTQASVETMTGEIFREFTFEAAHRLPHVPEVHKCARRHGLSYRIEVRVTGEVDRDTGWVMDFAEI